MFEKHIKTALAAIRVGDGLALRPDVASYTDWVLLAVNRFAYSRTNQVVIDGALVALALTSSYLLRFDGDLPPPFPHQLLQILPLAVALCLAFHFVCGVYDRVWRFFGLHDAAVLARSVGWSFGVTVAFRILDPGALAGTRVPYGVIIIFFFLAFAGMVGARVLRRVLYDRAGLKKAAARGAMRKRLLLVGAGEAGLHMLRELRDSDFAVVGFVDDDIEIQGRTIGGSTVLGTTHELESVAARHRVDEVILCMPSAPKAVLQRIVARCTSMSLKTYSVPTLWEILSGQLAIGQLRTVNMEDLLGRHSVSHPEDLGELTAAYSGKRILVTGAGGSIGSELVRQLSRFEPSQLILLDKDENNLYEITCEIREEFEHVIEVIADIRHVNVLERVFEIHRPEVVFHAAAYKHVPLMEHYPAEAILNNVMGTRHVAQLSSKYGVETFVFISTDKAVNPSSMMGASKRVAEMIVQNLASKHTRTRFCCVRFGNVLGSRASVVPIFQRQIRQGKNITVTHPDVSRYFMTIPEAVQLVIQAGSIGKCGEVFLLDMGDPVKIVDLARNLVELSGLIPGKDVTIEFTGLRPGEKLTEELLISGERHARSTKYSKIFVVEALHRDWSDLEAAVMDLEIAARKADTEEIHRRLCGMNIGYSKAHRPRATSPESAAAGTPVWNSSVPALSQKLGA